MADALQLAAFALPPTFPPERVAEACARFVRDCVPGLTRRSWSPARAPAAGRPPGNRWPA